MIHKLLNQRFGRLLVIEYAGLKGKHRRRKSLCDCGKYTETYGYSLKNGDTSSCGCLRKEGPHKTHNLTKTRIYSIWFGMKRRCVNKNNILYKNRGGRGIECEWESFEKFYEDMHESYEKHLLEYGKINTTIDRINNDGNYCKENCKRSTMKEQANNRRKNILKLK